ncbi:MAG TPA: Xaa-Pro peptidase family protein [Chloroflexota bacterium]|nr:Xaa-Pro peptidase family protein [Chloroflexota bacterium]
MSVDAERLDRVERSLRGANLDALVCRLAENIVLLTGYYPIVGGSVVVFPAEGEPILIAPSFEQEFIERGCVTDVRTYDTWQNRYPSINDNLARLLREVADDQGLRGSRIGVEGSFETIAPNGLAGEPTGVGTVTRDIVANAFGGDVIDSTDLLYELRATKTRIELDKIRIANEVASMGVRTFKERALEGQTEVAVAAAIESTILTQGTGYRGARFSRGFAQVTSGPITTAGNWNYPISSSRRLQRGDFVMVELGVVVDGYWSDLTRTVTVGPASARQREIYDTVKAAQEASLRAVRPGASGVEVDAAGRRIIDQKGYGEGFVHHTGHGIGFRYHEPIPFVAPHSSHVLAEGHVLSIEPGIYLEGVGGCRLEDICAVTADGGEFLSHTDFGLD